MTYNLLTFDIFQVGKIISSKNSIDEKVEIIPQGIKWTLVKKMAHWCPSKLPDREGVSYEHFNLKWITLRITTLSENSEKGQNFSCHKLFICPKWQKSPGKVGQKTFLGRRKFRPTYFWPRRSCRIFLALASLLLALNRFLQAGYKIPSK